MVDRTLNFGSGPSQLPVEVLDTSKAELHDYEGTGISVLELSHRSSQVEGIVERVQTLLLKNLGLEKGFQVLLMQGGATGHFAAVPLNLRHGNGVGEYVKTGYWAGKAIQQAPAGAHKVIADGKDDNYLSVPPQSGWEHSEGAPYLMYVANETIGGVRFAQPPASYDDGTFLIGDYSSSILSIKEDVSHLGMIFAGAQKNLGAAGLGIAVVRDDLLDACSADVQNWSSYKAHAKAGSRLNTPPVFSLYITDLVLQWIEKQGGVDFFDKLSHAKAQLLYERIDRNDFYVNRVDPGSRSLTNIVWQIAKPELEAKFLGFAKERNISGLKGHRSVGGLRAGVYNAKSLSDIEKLVAALDDFEARYG